MKKLIISAICLLSLAAGVSLLIMTLLVASCRRGGNDACLPSIVMNEKAETYPLQLLSDSIDIVDLEANEEGLVGIGIVKCIEYNHRFYLLNQSPRNRNILCYDHEGRYLFKIDDIGHGHGEYSIMNDVLIDKVNENLVVSVDHGRCLVYDLDGNFENQVQTNIYYPLSFLLMSDSMLFVHRDISEPPFDCMLMQVSYPSFEVVSKTDKPAELFGPFGPSPLCQAGDKCLYYNFNDTIYDMTSVEHPVAVYKVFWGEQNARQKQKLFKTEKKNHESGMERLQYLLFEEKMPGLGDFYISGDWMMLNKIELSSGLGRRVENSLFLFHTPTGKTYSLGIRGQAIGVSGTRFVIALDMDYYHENRDEALSLPWSEKQKEVFLTYAPEDPNPMLCLIGLM